MLDVVTIGRSSVDLYGQQIGGRLEDMASFAKAVGGSPTNIAIGCARLGLSAGLITRVGNEQMGRFVREQLIREGVDVRGVTVDAERLTALVLLGVRNSHDFPHIFFRENCADMAISEEDINPELINAANAILISGTHLSKPGTRSACMKAVSLAQEKNARIILDIDYRPNLWGLAGHEHGAMRFMESPKVTAMLRDLLPLCDLIVGTEEEFHIAGGSTDTLSALGAVRERSLAVLVVKLGSNGCVAFENEIPTNLNDGHIAAGFPVEVYNTLGAGDAFMAGLLRGWLRGEPWEISMRWANACGAVAVSRLLCSPEYPTWRELQLFLSMDIQNPRLRDDRNLAHVHRVTTRRTQQSELMALAIDHRKQLIDLCHASGADISLLERFKLLGIEAAARVAGDEKGFGIICDGDFGREALFKADEYGLWIARPVEKPGSIPLEFEPGDDLGVNLLEWPVNHTIKCLTHYHPQAPEITRKAHDRALLQLQDAALKIGREFLIEIIAGPSGPLSDDTVAAVLKHLYGLGIKPDWWKLEPLTSPGAWQAIDRVIADSDPDCRGIVILGQEADQKRLETAFRSSSGSQHVKGFAVGRTIFMNAAEHWFKGEIDDETAINEMAIRFQFLVDMWRRRNSSR